MKTQWMLLMLVAGTVAGQPQPAAPVRLTPETARQLALQHNEQLQIAQAEVRAAQSRQAVARTNTLPSVTGGVSSFVFGKPLNDLLPSSAAVTLGVSQPIYNGDKLRNTNRLAAADVQTKQTQGRVQQATTLAQVDQAYWQVVAAQEKVTLARTTGEALGGLLRELNNRLKAGLIDKNDVLRVQVRLNEAETNRLQAENGVATAKLLLAQLTGLPDPAALTLSDSTLATIRVLPPGDYVAQAQQARPEVSLYQQAIQAEELNAQIKKADYLPQIGIGINGLYNRNFGTVAPTGAEGNPLGGSFLTDRQFTTWYATLNVSIPIFHFGERQKALGEYKHRTDIARLRLQETRKQVAVEVQQALFRLDEATQKIDLAKLSVTQAAENLRMLNDKFRAGVITGKDVLEGQLLYQQAQTGLIDARVDYKLSETAFQRAVGTL